MNRLLVALAAITVMPGCALSRASSESYEPAGRVEYEEPCVGALYQIEVATHGEQAEGATRAYLRCLVDSGTLPPVDLQMRVDDQLSRNPYPAVSRDRAAVLSRFFDRQQVKAMPGNLREMTAYVGTLEDQALSARAQGDEKLAEAAETRANRVRSLMQVLEQVQG